jgi:uroporphyrinogen-III synthase
MRLLLTRPEPDALKLRAVLEELGHEATVEPLLEVVFDDGVPIQLDGVQAIVVTSRNALRAIKSRPELAIARRHTLFAVGKATAAEARALGFELVVTGAGSASELVTHIASVADPAAGLLLHLAGDRVAVDIKTELEHQGFRVVERVVYRMRPARALSDDTIEQLATGEIEGVILLSARTAAVYANLVRKHGLGAAVRDLPHFCLSAAVAGGLGSLKTTQIEVADAPRLEEVLALVDDAAAKSHS